MRKNLVHKRLVVEITIEKNLAGKDGERKDWREEIGEKRPRRKDEEGGGKNPTAKWLTNKCLVHSIIRVFHCF